MTKLTSTEEADACGAYCKAALATPDRFAEWLATMGPEAVVGVAGSGCQCPIAMFLTSQPEVAYTLADGRLSVFPDFVQIYTDRMEYSYDIPSWVCQFVTRVDAHVKGRHIARREAEQCLLPT